MQIYYEFFISATISSPKMTRDSNELNVNINKKHSTLIHIVLGFRNSAALYVLNAWCLIPSTIVALAVFLPFRIP